MKIIDLIKGIFRAEQSDHFELSHIKNLEVTILKTMQKPTRMKKKFFVITPLMIVFIAFVLISSISVVLAHDEIKLSIQQKIKELERNFFKESKKIQENGTMVDTPYGKLYDAETNEKTYELSQKTQKEIALLKARPEHERAKAIAAIKDFTNNPQLDVKFESLLKNEYKHIETYSAGIYSYQVDANTNQIIAIQEIPNVSFDFEQNTNVTPVAIPTIKKLYTPAQLEEKARKIAEKYTNTQLSTMEFEANNKKGENYFFRWTDKNRKYTEGVVNVDGGEPQKMYVSPSIQIGMNTEGTIVSYLNETMLK